VLHHTQVDRILAVLGLLEIELHLKLLRVAFLCGSIDLDRYRVLNCVLVRLLENKQLLVRHLLNQLLVRVEELLPDSLRYTFEFVF
jgi:hypothetical protein